MHFIDHYLTTTATTTYIENMDFVVLSCLNSGLTSIEQLALNKKKTCIHKNTCHKCLVNIFSKCLVYTSRNILTILVSFSKVFIEFSFIFTCEYKLALIKFTRYIY